MLEREVEWPDFVQILPKPGHSEEERPTKRPKNRYYYYFSGDFPYR